MNYKILSITETHISGYSAVLDSVAREHKYLAYLIGPPLEVSRRFVMENMKRNLPHFVAIHEEKVIGWCDITALNRPVFAHSGALGIGVLASYRRQGIGKALMRATIEKAKSIGLARIELTVRENNERAIILYKKLGFVIEGLHRNAVRIENKYENLISMALLFE